MVVVGALFFLRGHYFFGGALFFLEGDRFFLAIVFNFFVATSFHLGNLVIIRFFCDVPMTLYITCFIYVIGDSYHSE